MTRDKLWIRSELHWMWTYQAASAIGASYPLLLYFFQGHAELVQYSGLIVFMLIYFSLFALEIISLRRAEPPPWYMVTLEGCRFALASLALIRSAVLFDISLHASGRHSTWARIGESSLQDLVVFSLWWLVSYNGIVHVFSAWMLSRRREAHPESLSEFDHRGTLWLWPVHLARWTQLMGFADEHNRAKRILAYISWLFRAPFGSLGLYISLVSRGSLWGEPRMRVITPWGFRTVGHDLSKDPDSADYPPVHKPNVSIESTLAPWQRLPESCHDREYAHSLRTLGDEDSRWVEQPFSGESSVSSLDRRNAAGAPARRLRPRYLCILDEDARDGYRVEAASEGNDFDSVQYVFMSYTRMQFRTNIQGDPSLSTSQCDQINGSAPQSESTKALISMSVEAALRAGVGAFWIDFMCLRPDTPGDAEASRNIIDVYQICDIVRSSYCLAIAVGPPTNVEAVSADYSQSGRRTWLRQYGDRLWTLPEALLCPSNHGVSLYFSTQDGFECEQIEKRNLAARIWSDAETTRGLLEHYEGTLTLSQIEFISLALKCLQKRQTVTRMPADIIYALMGLLRERVPVREEQSAFEAFAHLSLANDSQKPLERLFCMRKHEENKGWHDMSDAWGAHIRDIVPICDIVGVASHDTVQIANMPAAAINWAPLPAVRFELARPSSGAYLWRWQRGEVSCILKLLYLLLFFALEQLAVVLYLSAKRSFRFDEIKPALNVQLLVLVVPVIISLLTTPVCLPSSIWTMYGGEIKNVEARFFGFHGIPDLGLVEETLFGRNCGRIAWSKLNARELAADDDDDAVYTLIDTWLMTASTFRASTRPSIVAVPGKHRGALRVMLCSYDETKGVYHRENVLRIDEQVLKRMSRMDSARFSLSPRPVFQDERPSIDLMA